MKKYLVCLFLGFVIVITVYPLDRNDINVTYVGRKSRQEFENLGGDSAYMKLTFQIARDRDLITDDFFRITENDQEDNDMIRFVFNQSRKLPAVRDTEMGETYVLTVIRGIYSRTRSVDGWFIITQPNTSGTWSYYLYYFEQHLR
jgi:hypothetical protein